MAVALLLGWGVVACGSDGETTEDTDETATTTTATTTTATSAGTTAPEVDTTTTSTSPDRTEAAEAGGVLDFAFAPVPEGMWQVETLGTPLDINLEGEWFVQPNETGWIVLTAPGSVGPGDRDVVFMRPTALADPESGERWPVDDIEGWLNAVGDDLVVSGTADTEVGGAGGIVFEVEATASSVDFAENANVSGKRFDPGHRFAVYWLDQGDHVPLAIIVGDHTDSFADWLPTAESLLESVSFGDPAPHPGG